MMPGSASRVGGIGAAPDYGEVVSKSFLLAHEPDWILVGLCAFFAVDYSASSYISTLKCLATKLQRELM